MRIFLSLIIIVAATTGYAEEEKISNSLTVSLVDYKKTNTGLVFQKPLFVTNQDWLWMLLNQVKLNCKLEQETLKMYAATITQLCTEYPSLLKKDEYHKLSPQEFALTYCHPTIDKVFAKLYETYRTKTNDNILTHANGTRSETKKYEDSLNINRKIEWLTYHIKMRMPNDFFSNFSFEEKMRAKVFITGDDVGMEDDNHIWKCTFNKKKSGKRSLKIEVFENIKRIGRLHATILSKEWETKVDIKWHDVISEKRNNGIGSTLLGVALNLFKLLKNNTKVTFLALTEKNQCESHLISYYKERGFIPSRRGYQYLMLYINPKGMIIDPENIGTYRAIRKMIKGETPLKISIPPSQKKLKLKKISVITPLPSKDLGKITQNQLFDRIASDGSLRFVFTPSDPVEEKNSNESCSYSFQNPDKFKKSQNDTKQKKLKKVLCAVRKIRDLFANKHVDGLYNTNITLKTDMMLDNNFDAKNL